MQNEKMKLIPIKQTIEENEEFVNLTDCKETIFLSINHYNKVGFHPPWIGYYAKIGDQYVGAAGFKGQPREGRIEIAYGTFERFRQRGLGTEICRQLVELTLKTDPSIVITARTFSEKNYSTRILESNDFELIGIVIDEEDGEVWEWRYNKIRGQATTHKTMEKF